MIQRFRRTLLLALAALLPAFSAQAQQPTPRPAAGPRLDATAAGFQRTAADVETLMQARPKNVGMPMALMIVGGAAIVLGLVAIDGDVGTLFAIGGAVALLYGLYLWLQ